MRDTDRLMPLTQLAKAFVDFSGFAQFFHLQTVKQAIQDLAG